MSTTSKCQYYKQKNPYITFYYRVDVAWDYYAIWDNEGHYWCHQADEYKGATYHRHWSSFSADSSQNYLFEISNPITPVKISKLEVLVALGFKAVLE